jgi:hypothetical protein
MNPILTTITPYWGRPDALRVWIKAIQKAKQPGVEHIVFFCGDKSHGFDHQNVRVINAEMPASGVRPSIGYFHNQGAELANSEWIMKLDVDALPNEHFFARILQKIEQAQPKEWFNVGMFYVNKATSESMLNFHQDVLTEEAYRFITKRIMVTTGTSGMRLPAATNFVCRRQEYIDLGGCDPRFRGWGWEDYQQIYMLEKHQQGADPLPGPVSQDNVTTRCRDEISRRKAKELYQNDPFLALLHRWHPNVLNQNYKNAIVAQQNQMVLLDHIQRAKQCR